MGKVTLVPSGSENGWAAGLV